MAKVTNEQKLYVLLFNIRDKSEYEQEIWSIICDHVSPDDAWKEDVIANIKTPERPIQDFGESREDYLKRVNEHQYKESVNRIRNSTFERTPSICIDIDGCKIMLKEDFIKREWYKTKEGGIPVRGQYEPAAHFLKRIDEYRKMKAEQKRKYDEELARKKQSILGRCSKAPLPKSEYEADEILKNYNG